MPANDDVDDDAVAASFSILFVLFSRPSGHGHGHERRQRCTVGSRGFPKDVHGGPFILMKKLILAMNFKFDPIVVV